MRAAVLVVAVLALIAFPRADASGATSFSGVGSRWAFQAITEWSFAYELIRPQVKISWDGQTTPQTLAAMQTGAIDFGAILSALPANLRAGGFAQWPITVAQTIVMYNLPTSIVPYGTLNLTHDALCDIWTGGINMWNDSRLVAKNPALASVNHTLTVIYRSDNNGGTSTFTGLMAQVPCASWNATLGPLNKLTFSLFPSQLTSLPNWVGAGETVGTCGAVAGTPYSISFAEQSWSLTNAPLLPTARLQAQDNSWSSTTDTDATTRAINNVVLPPSNTFNLAYLPGEGVYPFISFAYLLLNTTWLPDDCPTQREVLKFFRWALNDEEAQNIALGAGAISLPPQVRTAVLRQFENLTCNGEKVLRIVEIKQHRGAAFPVLLAFSMLFWFLSLIAIGASWWIGSRSKNPLFYACCLAAGTSLAFASLIFFYIVPSEDWVCQLRQWFLCMGLSLLFGVMFARGWQLHTLHTQKDDAPVSGKKAVVSTKALMVIMSILLGVQLVIMICWSAIDKFHSARVYPNTIDLDSRYICRSDKTILWLVLEVAYLVGLLAWGMYVVYRTWSSRAAVDSRWTLIAIYNTLMVIFVVIPLLATVAKTDDWVFYVAVLGTDFAIISAVGSIYGQVILRRIWDRVSGSGSGSGSKEGKVSTFRASMSGEGTIA